MTTAQKEQRAKRLKEAHECTGNFIALLRKLEILRRENKHERADRWYDYSFLKRMGYRTKSKGALKNES